MLNQLQTQGISDWITAAENGGSTYAYPINAVVRYSNALWISQVAANTAVPGADATKWAPFGLPTNFYNVSDTGAANAYVATLTPAITAYTTLLRLSLKVANSNTGASTLNLNTVGAVAIRKRSYAGALVALAGGELVAGNVYDFVHDGTYFQLLGQAGVSGTEFQQNSPIVPTAVGGTADAITATYAPAVTALTNGMSLMVRAAYANATTTPTFTPASGLIAAKTIVKGNGLALAVADIAGAGHWVELQYDSTLDKWVLLNPANGVSVPSNASANGYFRNLKILVTSSTAITVTADALVLTDGAGNYKTVTNFSQTIATGTAGAGGLDTGSIAASSWYNVYAGCNASGAPTAYLSLSATAPTKPSGYAFFSRLGAVRTASGSAVLLGTIQSGRRAQYVVGGANVSAAIVMASGTSGSATTPTWTAVAVGPFVPPTASAIFGTLSTPSTGGASMVAPNNSYGAYTSTTNPPPVMANVQNGYGMNNQFNFELESSNIYWAANVASTLAVNGWEDNL